ncbi:hypothetical protein LEP1GSC193_2837 [Leptospira alstonii serovar Pingchang str. 80-412]|uniref:Uncharacterized protein n=2 Tax=Leptospira alstonii TaxID=28452 RepID=M6CUB6_9LEPT|nr:hypothetical protein LEP1GSC194_0243 [Leptospira alstonii serovar Sichuan str. 79601]EQA78882.1 hypothetical protein LEP1GSC193_2837 [Leptospira alstonii serovar Pingchang str. 80-412]
MGSDFSRLSLCPLTIYWKEGNFCLFLSSILFCSVYRYRYLIFKLKGALDAFLLLFRYRVVFFMIL